MLLRYDLGLSRLGFEHQTFRLRGERSNPLCHRRSCFDVSIPYLAHWSITMTGFFAYSHDPDTMLIFDLKVNFIRFMTWLSVRVTSFLSFDKVLLCFVRKFITMAQYFVYIHDFHLRPQYQNYIFIMNLSQARSSLLFDISIQNFGIWVSPWDNMCTFLFCFFNFNIVLDYFCSE